MGTDNEDFSFMAYYMFSVDGSKCPAELLVFIMEWRN